MISKLLLSAALILFLPCISEIIQPNKMPLLGAPVDINQDQFCIAKIIEKGLLSLPQLLDQPTIPTFTTLKTQVTMGSSYIFQYVGAGYYAKITGNCFGKQVHFGKAQFSYGVQTEQQYPVYSKQLLGGLRYVEFQDVCLTKILEQGILRLLKNSIRIQEAFTKIQVQNLLANKYLISYNGTKNKINWSGICNTDKSIQINEIVVQQVSSTANISNSSSTISEQQKNKQTKQFDSRCIAKIAENSFFELSQRNLINASQFKRMHRQLVSGTLYALIFENKQSSIKTEGVCIPWTKQITFSNVNIQPLGVGFETKVRNSSKPILGGIEQASFSQYCIAKIVGAGLLKLPKILEKKIGFTNFSLSNTNLDVNVYSMEYIGSNYRGKIVGSCNNRLETINLSEAVYNESSVSDSSSFVTASLREQCLVKIMQESFIKVPQLFAKPLTSFSSMKVGKDGLLYNITYIGKGYNGSIYGNCTRQGDKIVGLSTKSSYLKY